MVLVIVEAIILLVLSVLKSVYQIYAALAIGQLANKHRILLSLGAYIGISMIMSILFLLIVAASDSVGTISWLSVFIANNDSDPFAISQMAIGDNVRADSRTAGGLPRGDGEDTVAEAEPSVRGMRSQ